uniref:Uncharacterized protein n=1 Tax=viral metagenome TaxID=1070528 RepID=A0A6M3J221_9ZZZZ
MGDIIGKSSEATKGGFQAIVEVEGVLESIERVESKFKDNQFGKENPDQAQVTLSEAVVLEMEPGEPEPELKDDKFVTWMNYARPGHQKPHVNSFFAKAFVASAEKLAKERGSDDPRLQDLYGQRIRLRKEEVLLFTQTDKVTGEKKDVVGKGYIFSSDSGDSNDRVDLDEYAKERLVGKNKSSALREAMMDSKLKRNPKYKQAVQDNKTEEVLGLTLVDGKYLLVESKGEES